LLGGGGSPAPSGSHRTTYLDQSRLTNQIMRGVEAARVVAVLDGWARRNYEVGTAEFLRRDAEL